MRHVRGGRRVPYRGIFLLVPLLQRWRNQKVVALMESLNPNHPSVIAVHDHWHKIAALLMIQMGKTKTIITPQEIERLDGCNICIRFDDSKGIELFIVDDEEAVRLARKEGGLPV